MYGMFLGSDGIHVKITTSAGTGRKIVMFKESYGNAFAPYLIDSFDEIYVIDIRYFGKNAVQYIKDVGATDVLFINNVFAANTSKLIDGIERLLISPTGTVVVTAPPVTTPAVSDSSDVQGLPAGQVSQVQTAQQTQAPVQQTQQSSAASAVTTAPAVSAVTAQSQQTAPAVTAPPATSAKPQTETGSVNTKNSAQ